MDKRRKLVRPYANGSWDKYYKQLSAFHKQHGHFEVPYASKKYRKLAHWLASQKFRRNAALLGVTKIQLLEDLGFEWTKKDSNQGRRERIYKMLNDFYKKNRHCNVPYKLTHWEPGSAGKGDYTEKASSHRMK